MEIIKAGLSELTKEIMELKKDIVINFWRIGERLNKIKTERLYEEKYHFFQEYLESEVKFSERSAHKYMKLATSMEESRVTLLSLRQWDVLLPLKEEQQQEVISKIEPFKRERGYVPEKEFRRIIAETKVPLKDSDFSKFFELNQILKLRLNKVKLFCEEWKVEKAQVDYAFTIENFKYYPKKDEIIALRQEIIQKLGNL